MKAERPCQLTVINLNPGRSANEQKFQRLLENNVQFALRRAALGLARQRFAGHRCDLYNSVASICAEFGNLRAVELVEKCLRRFAGGGGIHGSDLRAFI